MSDSTAKHHGDYGGNRFHRFSLSNLLNKQNNTNDNSQGESQNPELLQYISKMPSFSKKISETFKETK